MLLIIQLLLLETNRFYDTSVSPSIEVGTTEVTVGLRRLSFGFEQYNALLSQIEELENCILEMSEIIYA